MGVDGDDKVIEMKRSFISKLLDDDDGPERMPELREGMPKPEAERAEEPDAAVPSGDVETAIPRRGDPYDKAYARPSSRALPGLCLVLADGTRRSYPYSGRVGGPDWLETPGGLVIVQRFSDVVPVETVFTGCLLDELYEYLFYQKLAWVRALPAGKMIHNRAMPIITGILVRPWQPDPGG